jgi:hypothetical protein
MPIMPIILVVVRHGCPWVNISRSVPEARTKVNNQRQFQNLRVSLSSDSFEVLLIAPFHVPLILLPDHLTRLDRVLSVLQIPNCLSVYRNWISQKSYAL